MFYNFEGTTMSELATAFENSTDSNHTLIGNAGMSSKNSFNDEYYDSIIFRVQSLLYNQPVNFSSENVTHLLSYQQVSQLAEMEPDSGVLCLLKMWFGNNPAENENDLRCSAVWDNFYCWPSALAGTITKRLCREVLQEIRPLDAPHLQGYAVRQCLNNGSWSRGVKTNYSQCARAFLTPTDNSNDENLTQFVQYMVFIGTVLSFLCLGIVLTIFLSFRSVWTERIKVHVHLMCALVLRFLVFLIISESFVLERTSSYRDNSILCKAVLIAHLYATVASTSWMLVQGIYLNGKVSTNVFGYGSSRDFYKFYLLGWVFPFILLAIYVLVMIASQHSADCWEGYAEMTEIWILLVPMKAEMLVNGFLMCNILRIVLKKRRFTYIGVRLAKLKSIGKVTLFLFPILGLSNLLFLYNPGGKYETLYVSLNISFGSTQGILVAIVYWYNCTEVHKAIRCLYNRFLVRRSVGNSSLNSRNRVEMVCVRVPVLNQPLENEVAV